MNMKFIVQNSCLAFVLVLFVGQLAMAQGIVLDGGIVKNKVALSFSEGKKDSVTYFEIRDSTAFASLQNVIRPDNPKNYPLCVVKMNVVGPFISLVQNYESQLESYKTLEQEYKDLDTIQQKKIAQLDQIIKLQETRADNYKALSENLRTTNNELSAQLDQSLKIAKDCNNSKVRKQVLVGIIGGAVGFSIASLIALVK